MAVLREADTQNGTPSPGGTSTAECSTAWWLSLKEQEDGTSNGDFGRVAVGPRHAAAETLADLVCFVWRTEEGGWDLGGPDTQDIAGMPCTCLRAVFFPLLNEGLEKSLENSKTLISRSL